MSTLKKIFDLLAPSERKQTALLFFMIFIMAILDMLGVASVMPFIAVAANPQLIETNLFLSAFYEFVRPYGINSIKLLLILLGSIMLFILVFSLIFKAITTYIQLRFTLIREYSIGKRLVEGYLHQPYSWFLDRNSADLGKNILSEVGVVIGSILLPLIIIISQSAIAIALFILLVLVDPILSISVSLALVIAYIGIFVLLKGKLSKIGLERANANEARFTALSEAFGAAKEVKVSGLEKIYINRFAKPAKVYALRHASASVMGLIPRFFLEAIAFGGMIVLILILTARANGLSESIPLLALYAFAGYRLMPALQQIYLSSTQIRFGIASLNLLHKSFTDLEIYEKEPQVIEKINFHKNIELNNIYFNYPNSKLQALTDFNLNIPVYSKIGIVGVTGSGKTTAVDLIMGLFEAQKGTLSVDGKIIDIKNRRSWQKSIGYVPQQIFLSDETIASNIAFGVNKNNINMPDVIRAAKIANLHDFIVNDLPNAYDTKVGERGVRLSGGQLQRIGIARALYHKPQVLILDEATSALDNLTEQVIMDAMNNLGNKITIILIAHRLSTVKSCDQVYLLEKGKIKSHGSYEELNLSSKSFKDMTNLEN